MAVGGWTGSIALGTTHVHVCVGRWVDGMDGLFMVLVVVRIGCPFSLDSVVALGSALELMSCFLAEHVCVSA